MVGLARGAFDAAMPHLHERKQFGSRIAGTRFTCFTGPDNDTLSGTTVQILTPVARRRLPRDAVSVCARGGGY